MTVGVKRLILVSPGLSNTMKKLYPQDMKLECRRGLLKFIKIYEVELKETRDLIQQYSTSEDGKKQIIEFLNTLVELPCLPQALLEDEKLNLSTEDLFFLEHFVS